MDLSDLRKAQLVESGGCTLNDKGKLCIQGYMDLGDLGSAARKSQLAESGDSVTIPQYRFNKTKQHTLHTQRQGQVVHPRVHGSGRFAQGPARRERCLHTQRQGQVVNQGYMDLGNFGSAARKDQLVESDGYTLNDKGKLCIQGYRDLGSSGGVASAKISAAKALDEHHTHICISVLC